MNVTYQRFLTDDGFRAAILARARRERSAAMSRFFMHSVRYLLFGKEPRYAARTNLARQG